MLSKDSRVKTEVNDVLKKIHMHFVLDYGSGPRACHVCFEGCLGKKHLLQEKHSKGQHFVPLWDQVLGSIKGDNSLPVSSKSNISVVAIDSIKFGTISNLWRQLLSFIAL